jgi:hypothetical protein
MKRRTMHTQKLRYLSFCLAISCGAWLVGPAPLAATIERGRSNNCTLQLRGEISEGDTIRLKEAVRALPPSTDHQDVRLCLDSLGGSFNEAVEISRFLTARSHVNTVVDKDQQCFSACALVFMFGNHYDGDNLQRPQRELHVQGRLGFHAPYIDANAPANSQTILAKAYREGILAVGRLLDADWEDRLPKALLIDFLNTGPDATVEVDTVGRAAAWQIDLIGVRRPYLVSDRDLEWACLNATLKRSNRWASRWWSDGLFGKQSQPRESSTEPVTLRDSKYQKVFHGFGGEASYVCVADLYRDARGNLHLSVNTDFADGEPLPSPRHLERSVKKNYLYETNPLWLANPRERKLRELAER